MFLDKNVVVLFRTKSPSLKRCKEGDLPRLKVSNLICTMYAQLLTISVDVHVGRDNDIISFFSPTNNMGDHFLL